MKKWLTMLGVLIVLVIGLFTFVFVSLKPVGQSSEPEIFVVAKGDNKIKIADHLAKGGFVKNKYATIIYMFINPGLNLQAGTYELQRNQSTQEIINKIATGDIVSIIPTVRITFVEGKTFEDYAKLIAKNFSITEDDIYKKVKDKKYLQSLIDEYWFLDDSILNDELFYSLEGYLAPDTYEIYSNATIEDIFKKQLDNTDKRLTKYKEEIEKSKYSVHELLSLASIVEKEANTKEDREKVSQVLYKRLSIGQGLGCDVTTYYAVHKSLKEPLYYEDLGTDSPYNTSERNKKMAGKIPVGPICNPGESSILATLHPADTKYLYFVAEIQSGKVYFAENYEDFVKLKNKYVK